MNNKNKKNLPAMVQKTGIRRKRLNESDENYESLNRFYPDFVEWLEETEISEIKALVRTIKRNQPNIENDEILELVTEELLTQWLPSLNVLDDKEINEFSSVLSNIYGEDLRWVNAVSDIFGDEMFLLESRKILRRKRLNENVNILKQKLEACDDVKRNCFQVEDRSELIYLEKAIDTDAFCDLLNFHSSDPEDDEIFYMMLDDAEELGYVVTPEPLVSAQVAIKNGFTIDDITNIEDVPENILNIFKLFNESRNILRRKSLNESNRKRINRKRTINEAAKAKRVKVAAYNKIMRDIVPLIKESLDENEMNELFGFGGNSVEKPSTELTTAFIKDASNEELADAMAEHMNYWMAKTGDNVDKAIMSSINQIHEICQSSKENCQKLLMGMVKSIKDAFTSGSEKSKLAGRMLLMGCAICVKLVANDISMAKNALTAIYNKTAEFLTSAYDACKSAVEKGLDSLGDKVDTFCKVSVAVITLVGKKFINAEETFVKWVKQVIEDVKNEVKFAALLVRTWFDVKVKEVGEFLNNTYKDLRKACVNAYNKLDKSIRKGWQKMSEKAVKWINNVSLTISKLADKISDTVTKTGDAIIAGKDKAVLAGINKAVKMLSKNYSEDDVIAIVRKAYNEGLTFDTDGRCVINENYYMNTRLQLV